MKKYNGNHYVKHFTCCNQLHAMMFGQFSNRESLCDLIVALQAHKSKRYHLGLGRDPIAKTTLAAAKQNRDYSIFEDFTFYMMKEASEKRATNILNIPRKKYAFDQLVLGRFRDGVYWNADGSWSFSDHYKYTWIWSSLTFGVTVMLGAFAGQIIKNGSTNRAKVVKQLLLIGLALIGASLLWSLQMPVIKRLWTCSMTLLAGGYSFLLMALFYYWVDYCGNTKGLNWLKIYGMNSITAYILGEVVNFRSIANSVSYGL